MKLQLIRNVDSVEENCQESQQLCTLLKNSVIIINLYINRFVNEIIIINANDYFNKTATFFSDIALYISFLYLNIPTLKFSVACNINFKQF